MHVTIFDLIEARSRYGRTVLHYAAKSAFDTRLIIDQLLTVKPDLIDVRAHDGRNILQGATNEDVIMHLLAVKRWT